MPSLAAGRALDRASQSAAPGPAGAPSIRRPGTTVHASSCSRAPTTLCALLAEHLSGFRIQGSGHGVYTVAALSRLACMFVAEGVVLCPLCVIINMVFHSNIEVGDDGDHDGSTAPDSGARGRGRDRAGGLFGGGPGRGAGLRPR